jgi:hypothetical protein
MPVDSLFLAFLCIEWCLSHSNSLDSQSMIIFLIQQFANFFLVFQEMGLLEIKHGLLQVAETLDFLHNNAHLAHRAISPEVPHTTILLHL